MLNYIEMSDLRQFQGEMPDCREKELLHKVLFEYNEYCECGTVEDCKQRKEWMSYSIDTIREAFAKMVKGFQEEVEIIREDEKRKKKRGRPPKNRGGGERKGDDA